MITRMLAVAALVSSICSRPAIQHTVAGGTSCTVARIVDGDTFVCADSQRVRLIGIDSPERGQRPFGAQAQHALQRFLPPGRPVRLERDVGRTDRYGRLLAYVWVGDTLINEMMVRGGWAVLLTVPPNVKYVERLLRAQKAAQEARAGLWAENGFRCLPVDYKRGRCGSAEGAALIPPLSAWPSRA